MTAAAPDGLCGLGFLAGRWRGEGTVRGRPATSRGVCRPSASSPDALSMQVATSRDGRVIHEEDILWMPATGRAVRCVTRPATGDEQVWRVTRLGADAWELARPGFVWTIRRTESGYEETFDAGGADGNMVRVVALRHVRDEEAGA